MLATLPIAERFAAPLPGRTGLRKVPRFTWPEALELVRLGMIPEDATTELFDGHIVLVDRSGPGQEVDMIGEDHIVCTELLSDLRGQINGLSRHVRSQQPLVLAPTYAPLPDFMIIRGTVRDYSRAAPPTAADALCVVEVADSSYDWDTNEKRAAYARAGIPQYVVIALARRVAEVYANSDRDAATYPPPTIVPADGMLALRVGDDGEMFELRLADVLP